MKTTKFGRFTAKLLIFAMIMSLFTVMPAANAAADEEQTATITATDRAGATVGGTYQNIESAVGTLRDMGGGTVHISEGVVKLETGIYIQADNVTVEGAGMDKTIIKPADCDTYIKTLQEEKGTAAFSNATRLIEALGNYITLKDMTIDGRGISGEGIDFVPLRLTGGEYGVETEPGNVTIDSIEVLRDTTDVDKGSIQIGSNLSNTGSIFKPEWKQSKCNVTAINSYVYGNTCGTSYADIDICANSTLCIDGGMISGSISSDADAVTFEDKTGYYSATIQEFSEGFVGLGKRDEITLYATIPYLVEYYENNKDNTTLKAAFNTIIAKLAESDINNAEAVLQSMADDLENRNLRLYGLYCDDKKQLAIRYLDMLNGIKNDGSIDIENTLLDKPIKTVQDAVDVDDWHTWDENNTCEICKYEKATVESLAPQVVPKTYSDGTVDYDQYGVRFVFGYNAGTENMAVENYGAYVLDTDIFNEGQEPSDSLLTDKTKLDYNGTGNALQDEESFSVDVVDIPAGKTIYAVPFAGETFGDIVSQAVSENNLTQTQEVK